MEQIIRCENCEYFREWDDGSSPTCLYWTDQWDMGTEPNGFCSFGKLKSGCEVETYESIKHGHWNKRYYAKADGSNLEMYWCSNCREEFSYDAETGVSITDYNYCPHCGAKIDEVK